MLEKLTSKKFLAGIGAIIAVAITAHPKEAPYIIAGIVVIYIVAEATLDKLALPQVSVTREALGQVVQGILSSAAGGLSPASSKPPSVVTSITMKGGSGKPEDVARVLASAVAASVAPDTPPPGTKLYDGTFGKDILPGDAETAATLAEAGVKPGDTIGIDPNDVIDPEDATQPVVVPTASKVPATAPSGAAAAAALTGTTMLWLGMVFACVFFAVACAPIKREAETMTSKCGEGSLAAIEAEYTADVAKECKGQTFDACTERPAIEAKYAAKREEWIKCH